MHRNIRSLAHSMQRLQQRLPAPESVDIIEDWPIIARILYDTPLCESCRARLDQALAIIAQQAHPEQGYLLQQWEWMQQTIHQALMGDCMYAPDWNRICKIRIADAIAEEQQGFYNNGKSSE